MVKEIVKPEGLLQLLRRRRVTRQFGTPPVYQREIDILAEAAYWAPSGGNRRPIRLLATTDQGLIERIVAVSPGIYGRPKAVIAVCIDWTKAPHVIKDEPRLEDSVYLDAGSSLAFMLLMAEALGVGACPVMSFHRSSVSQLLDVPSEWTPLILVIVGRRAPSTAVEKRPARLKDFLQWRGDTDEELSGGVGSAVDTREPVGAIGSTDVKRALMKLAAFYAAAASGNVSEHPSYAPVRLLQGVQRVSEALSELGIDASEIASAADLVESNSIGLMGDHQQVKDLADEVLALLRD